MPTEQCVFLILYIHGILYMYITKYSCVFLKLGESIYMAMDLIPILLGSLPLAHNAQHSLVIYAIVRCPYGAIAAIDRSIVRTYARTYIYIHRRSMRRHT